MAFEIARCLRLVDEALTDYRRLTYTSGSLAAKSSRELDGNDVLLNWPPALSALEKVPSVLRNAGYRSAFMYICEAQQQHRRLLEDVPYVAGIARR